MQESQPDPAEQRTSYNPSPEEGELVLNSFGKLKSNEVYEKIILEDSSEERTIQPSKPTQEVHEETLNQERSILEQKETQIKILEDGYNPESENQPLPKPQDSQHQIIQEEKANQCIEQYEQNEQPSETLPQNDHTNEQNLTQPVFNFSPEPTPQHYNSYMQAVLSTPMNPSSQPSHQALEEIYNELKVLFPEVHPEQIILLLYNNLIKAPREELLEEESHQYDNSVKYDGGQRYWNQVSRNMAEMGNFELRKEMIKVYVTKGYGLKVFQEYMKSVNPSAPEIDKEKFKKHFIEIYKIIIRKVEEFLTNTADRQFEPLRRDEYQKPLTDVINCKKHYSSEFCEIYYRILQATFDKNFQKVPNEEEVIFFYRSIMEKLRGAPLPMVKKLHQYPREQDPDVWTWEFEKSFISDYIRHGSISQARAQLLKKYPECEVFVEPEKLAEKIQNGIRVATNWLAVQNTNCGNPVVFSPSDIDRKFIMTSPNLQASRIKLLKVYLVRPTDKKVLENTVEFIHSQLRKQYEIEKIPEEVMKKNSQRQLPRAMEKSGLEALLKSQLNRNY